MSFWSWFFGAAPDLVGERVAIPDRAGGRLNLDLDQFMFRTVRSSPVWRRAGFADLHGGRTAGKGGVERDGLSPRHATVRYFKKNHRVSRKTEPFREIILP